jgi:dCMP deaminase
MEQDNTNDKETTTLSNGKVFTMRRDKAIKYYKLTYIMANLLSKDPSTKVGAILLNPDTLHVLSMGYNGMPRNVKEYETEKWTRPIKYKYVEHAERNAIYNAAHSGTPLKDSICVASMCPCTDCARGLIQSGCRMVITRDVNEFALKNPDLVERWKPEWDISIPMMEEAGIKIIMLTESEIKIDQSDIL